MDSMFLISGLALWLYMSSLFLIATIKRDNSIADIGYGIGFLVVAYAGLFFGASPLGHNFSLTEIVLVCIVTLWGARLSLRIFLKNKGKGEDFRYATWRKEWKWFYLRSYLQVFMLQGVIIYVIALPVLLVENLSGFDTTDLAILLLGVVIWTLGYFFEVIGDLQLDRFIKNPDNKGKLMTTGLWRYSRHPNYFGESTMWWGIWVISLSATPALWYLTLVSPLLITFLLLKVSGIPLLEARMSQHPDWESYARKTNAFFPWCTKRE